MSQRASAKYNLSGRSGGVRNARAIAIREKSMGRPAYFGPSPAGGCRIRHTEYLGDVTTSATAGQFYLAYGGPWLINPGNSDTFPWLSNIANQFEEYEFHGLMFHFRSTSTDAVSSNTNNLQLGVVIGATDYNVLHPAFTSKQQMDNYEYTTSGKPSLSWDYPVECKRGSNVLNRLYVTNNLAVPAPQSPDPRMYHLGQFQIATAGFQGQSVNVGELWVTYDVTLAKPQLPTISPTAGFIPYMNHYYWSTTRGLTGVDATHPWGTQTASSVIDPSGTSQNAGLYCSPYSSAQTQGYFAAGGQTFTCWGMNAATSMMLITFWAPSGGYVTQPTTFGWAATQQCTLEFLTEESSGSAGGVNGNGQQFYSPGTSGLTGSIGLMQSTVRFQVSAGSAMPRQPILTLTSTGMAFGGTALYIDAYLVMLPTHNLLDHEEKTLVQRLGAQAVERHKESQSEKEVQDWLDGKSTDKFQPKSEKKRIPGELVRKLAALFDEDDDHMEDISESSSDSEEEDRPAKRRRKDSKKRERSSSRGRSASAPRERKEGDGKDAKVSFESSSSSSSDTAKFDAIQAQKRAEKLIADEQIAKMALALEAAKKARDAALSKDSDGDFEMIAKQ